MYQSKTIRANYQDIYEKTKKQLYIWDLAANKDCIVKSNGEIFTDDFVLYKDIQKKLCMFDSGWWETRKQWPYKTEHPQRYKHQLDLICNKFLPLYSKDGGEKSDLFDVACADGEWTALLASHVDHVDGYEYSLNMLESAKKNYANIKNISFYHADAVSMHVNHVYDGGACMGLITCLSQYSEVVIKKLSRMMRIGGYLVVKDTLNDSYSTPIYMINYNNGYTATYHDIDGYKRRFEEAGFVLVHEDVFERLEQESGTRVSLGTIWQRQR